ncbi:hypothetical protein ASG60_02985 [Methylobacterium sp. Leaf469]|jgi:hypothetical protein|uniref:hypothetical protein n=1 Tax=unclassified Methylobacterium TaxID=2615210 RepID=UPI0006F3CE1D|nr:MULTISPECIES: hypothetical protein [unclassified Methylobacterium]KQP34562.1 hypothetical protein ASF27_03210 [Methylobacterium sp. Leaf102]KQP72080.1 hypothetical protein ASF52_00650 [Methylobacterium sp. Leaf112]KQU05636.1 hypothetical protein ASG60_02985 [Methylobacterium sp. Leaf469]USU33674.1 hypothetical protein NG677_08430 [Methylobacterium sp. OTU13CASTA1]
MSDSVLASVAFPSLNQARSARDRLARAGFARNSIDIIRHDDDFSVAINTRPENKARAERILTGSPLADDLRRAGDSVATAVNGNRGLALGLAALAGFALFGLTRRR